MPILKYTLFVSCLLLALLFVAERTLAPVPSTISNSSTSLEVLRKMANHGESRGFAPLAAASAFMPMPMAAAPTVLAVASAPSKDLQTVDKVSTAPHQRLETPALLNAQARVSEAEVIDQPSRPARKVATKRPKHSQNIYVENVSRGPTGFFGTLQSW